MESIEGEGCSFPIRPFGQVVLRLTTDRYLQLTSRRVVLEVGSSMLCCTEGLLVAWHKHFLSTVALQTAISPTAQ